MRGSSTAAPVPSRKRHVAAALTCCILVVLLCIIKSRLDRELTASGLNRRLIESIEANDVSEVSVLLDAGASPNALVSSDSPRTFLEQIMMLLRRQTGPRSPSALMISVEPLLVNSSSSDDLYKPRNEQVEITRSLVKHGANLDYRDAKGNTALNYAAAWLDGREVEILVLGGANVNNRSNIGETPLMEAVSDNNIDGVGTLLAHNADVNVRSALGYTALIYAVMGGDSSAEVVRQLLRLHADVAVVDASGRSALDYAGFTNSRQVVDMLRAAGAR